jgi:hypothetical protein
MAAALRRKSGKGGGASAVLTGAQALRRGGRGVGVLRCRTRLWNRKERPGEASVAFDRRERKGGRSGAGSATWRKEGGGPGSIAPRGGGRCGGPGGVWREVGDEGGSGRAAAAGPLPWAGPRAQCRF